MPHGARTGKLKAQELIDFLSQHAGEAPAAEDASIKGRKKAGKAGTAGDQDDDESDDKDKVVPQVGCAESNRPQSVQNWDHCLAILVAVWPSAQHRVAACRPNVVFGVVQVVQELSLEALDALVDDEDAWLVAFYKGKVYPPIAQLPAWTGTLM